MSALAGFHVDPLSWSNWNLDMLVFVEGGKLENPEKNLQSKFNPHMALGWNQTQATLVGGEGCHDCIIHT